METIFACLGTLSGPSKGLCTGCLDVYWEYHDKIREVKEKVGRGLLIDVHGHAHDHQGGNSIDKILCPSFGPSLCPRCFFEKDTCMKRHF